MPQWVTGGPFIQNPVVGGRERREAADQKLHALAPDLALLVADMAEDFQSLLDSNENDLGVYSEFVGAVAQDALDRLAALGDVT